MARSAARTEEVRPDAIAVRPEAFLFPAWRGHGVYCDAFGLPAGKYESWGEGRREDDGTVVLDFHTRLDTGVENHFAWAVAPEQGKRFRLIDRISGQESRGDMCERGFTWSWSHIHATPLGLRRCRVRAVYTLIGSDEASTDVTISLFGVMVGSSASHIRHTPA